MTHKKKRVYIHKGFMKFDEFYEEVMKEDLSEAIVMHFRIATHGKVVKKLTHPFVLWDDATYDKDLSIYCDEAMAHNGCIPGMKTNEGVSDSLAFARLCSQTGFHEFCIENEGASHFMEAAIGTSRVVFMDSKGWYRYGTGWTVLNKCLYSNTTFEKPRPVRKSKQHACGDGGYTDWWKNAVPRKALKHREGFTREPLIPSNKEGLIAHTNEDAALVIMGFCPYCYCDLALDRCSNCGIEWSLENGK